MSRNLVLPFFPVPPDQYDQQYMEEIVRSFSTYLRQMQNPGEGRHTELVLTNLQTHDQGLEVGALFIDKDVSIMRDRRNNTTKPMTMKELRQRIDAGERFQYDSDWSCMCFNEPEDYWF